MSKFRELVLDIQKNLYDYTHTERMRYKNIYDIIDTYVINNKLFVSNIYKITNSQRSTASLINYHYDIYCDNPLRHANNLINKIYEGISGDPLIQYLNLNTTVKHEEFVIIYDTRMMAKIYTIQSGYSSTKKNVNLSTNIIPVIIDKIKYLPPSIEIIDMYNILYTGTGYDEVILNLTINLSKMVTEKTGGDIQKIEKTIKKTKHLGSAEQTCYDKKKNELEAIKLALLRDYFKGRLDIVLIGSIGYNWYLKGDNICPNMERIQIITSVSSKEIQHDITQYIEGIGRNYKITSSGELGLMIPKDFRSKKTILSLIINTPKGPKEKPFLEIFNNSTFELIPAFLSNNILIGGKYVLLRFMYIDLWISNFVFTIGKMTKEKYVDRQKKILQSINNISTIKNIADGVLGTYYDYAISKNELIFNQEQFFGPYNVDSYYKKNKTLRTI
jgi:hypothetical protein